MVKVIPNLSSVTAKIRDVSNTDEPDIFEVNLEIMSANPVSGYQDLVSQHIGKTIKAKLVAKNKIESGESSVKLLIKYEGDEHGGSFYAKTDDSS